MARLKYHQTILKILWDDHLTADDIYDIMKKKYGRIGIATIYRTLEHLIDTKEITKLVGVFDKAYFEKNKWPHMHFVDRAAYKIIDVPLSDYSFLPKQEWFSVSYADIVVYGSIWNTVASGLFEKTNDIIAEKNIQTEGSWDDLETLPPDPFFSMQDVASVVDEKVINEDVVASVDKVDIQDVGSPSAALEEQPQANIPTVPQDVLQETWIEEDLVKQEKEEEKKKRRELKNIFRQF